MDSLRKYNILIVDDTDSWRDLLSQVLEDYNVTAAKSAGDALKAIALHEGMPFNVAVIDKRLLGDTVNDESGLDLAREIRSIVRDCQIIILTGYEDHKSTRRAFKEVSVFDVLEKYPEGGFDNQRLRDTVMRAILATAQHDTSLETKENYKLRPGTVTILQLSDLHFGEDHRFQKVRDKRFPHEDMPSLQKALITSLKTSGKQPDIVVVSGDLTERGDFQEFNQALSFLKGLEKALKLDRKRFIVVPGNHDVRWSKQDAGADVGSDKMTEYRGFYELLYKQRPIEQSPLCRVQYYEFKDKPNVALIGFDSCVIENGETAGIGYVGVTQLNNALAKLKSMTANNTECMKIAVLHHHLIPVASLEKLPTEKKSFSLVADATKVLMRLQEEGFALILHGHQHQPFCAELRFPLARTHGQKPMAIIGMGSAGIRPSPDLVGGARNNHYGILEISKALPDVPAEIHVSWYQAEGNDPDESFELYKEFTLQM